MILELSAKGRKVAAYALLTVIYWGTIFPPQAIAAAAPLFSGRRAAVSYPASPAGGVEESRNRIGPAYSPDMGNNSRPLPSGRPAGISAPVKKTFNGGPGQPEAEAFHSVSSSNMVDLFTGDFSYTIPLVDVGGYPVAIGYNSGVSMDQEASWVGLGWNINPGAVNRNMRGLPDDFNGVDTIHKTMSVKDNKTIGVNVGADLEITGFPLPVKPSVGASLGIFHNSYKGWGMEQSFNAGVNGGSKSMGTFSGSLSLTSNSQEGLTVNQSLSYQLSDEEAKSKGGYSGGIGFGTSYNSRAGLRTLQLSGGLRHYKVDQQNNKLKAWGTNYGSSISFANPTFSPSMSMRYTNTSFSFTGKVGWETKVVHPSVFVSGYVSKQGIADEDKNLSLPAYGYLNYQHANGNPGVLLDYNREKDIPYREKPSVPNIALPYYTYDVFSMSGEGTGGMFRAYRGDIGFVHDHYMRSKDLSLSGSVDIGLGDIAHAGGDIHLNRAITETGPWTEQNPLGKTLTFRNSYRYFEAAYFKNPGEMTWSPADFYNTIGGEDLVSADLYQPGNIGPVISTTTSLNRYRNQQIVGKLPLTAASVYKNKRDHRSQAISYLTAEEASIAGLSKYLENYTVNNFNTAGCNNTFPDELGGKGVGLKGEYFAGKNFERKLFERTDAGLNFTTREQFNYHIPQGASGVWDNFSVRWTGRLKVAVTGEYKVSTLSDDGVRLFINDSLVIDRWTTHSATWDAAYLNLVEGQVLNIRLEYYQGKGRCAMGLYWQINGAPNQLISAENLYLMPTADTFVVSSALSKEKRVNDFRKPHHISEIRVLNDNGKQYVYGLPVYSLRQKDVSFAVDAAGGDPKEGLVSYVPGEDNSIGNKKGKDNFFSSEEMPPYAHSYLLTGILSPDYSDVTGDGITDDDLGIAVKFNYSKVAGIQNPYSWRAPNNQKASYNEGLRTDKRDDRGSYVSGEKEIWYLHSIESGNMIATFRVSEREDVYAMDENGVRSAAVLKKLDEINLYVKAEFQKKGEGAKPVKTVHFEYDYELCPGVNQPVSPSGKLTLKRIWFSFNGNKKGIRNPYVFRYNQHNPSYSGKAYDRWGNYKKDMDNPGSSSGNPVTNADYPYALQDSTVAAYNAAAWTLDSIVLPEGGRMKITYESDDYGFVQNRKAMQMFQLAGFSINKPNSADDLDNTLYSLSDHLYVAVNVPRPVSSDKEVYTRYLDGSEKLFFRLNVKMPSDKFGSGNEYIPCYATLEPGSYGYFNNGSTIWMKVKPIDSKGKTGNLLSVNSPLALAAIQFLRLNLPSKAYPGSDVGDNLDLLDGVKVLMSQTDNLITSVVKFDHIVRMRGWAKQVDLNRSTVRLNNPYHKKYGGGQRVKSIRIYDHWNGMTQQKESVYGQEYQYTTTRMIDGVAEEISSGVASYEPVLGGEENPFREPLEYIEQVAPLAPVTMGYTEAPIGESLFPAPSVGYSKVRVRSIHVKNKRSANGFTEACFYTAYDFPTATEMTPLADAKKRFKPLLANFLRINARHFVTVSQGFKIELNNMHGKMKSEASYAETDMKNPVSYTEYFYRVQDQLSEFKQLKNETVVLADGWNPVRKDIGKDIELMVDMRQQRSVTNVNNLNINGDLFTFSMPPVFLIPMLLQLAQREETQFRSVGMTKVVNKNGILDSIVTIDKGSRITTRNLLFDGETGMVMLNSRDNEFEDPIYHYKIPAGRNYFALGNASKQLGLTLNNLTVRQGRVISGINQDSLASYALFQGGEEFFYTSRETVIPLTGADCAGSIATYPTKGKVYVWMSGYAEDGAFGFNLIDENGKPFGGNDVTLKLIRSSGRNMNVVVDERESLGNPLIPYSNNSGYYYLWYSGEFKVTRASATRYLPLWKVEDRKKAGSRSQYVTVPYATYAAGDTCGKIYYGNTEMSQYFTRDDCPEGNLPIPVKYTVPAGRYSSEISVEDANQRAIADMQSMGSEYARMNGLCKRIYYSAETSREITRNNCPPGAEPGSVIYTVPAGKDTSTISQAAADALAVARIDANGQDHANTYASCTYRSAALDSMFRKNNCPPGGTGSLVRIQYTAGAFTSTVSQAEADQLARAEGQADANDLGSCTYVNAAINRSIAKNDCPGGSGTLVPVQIAAGIYPSTVSQADADAQAEAAAQAYANTNGKCTLNATVNWYCTDNNCDYQGQPFVNFVFPQPTTSEIRVQLGVLFYYANFPKYVYLGSNLFTPPAGAESFFGAGLSHLPLEIVIPAGTTTYTAGPYMYLQGYQNAQPYSQYSWWWCQSCQAQVRDLYIKIGSAGYVPNFTTTNSGVTLHNLE